MDTYSGKKRQMQMERRIWKVLFVGNIKRHPLIRKTCYFFLGSHGLHTACYKVNYELNAII